MMPFEKPIYGSTNPDLEKQSKMSPQRFASVVGLVDSKEQEYRELHADVWPSILIRLKQSNIHNYSIYTHELEGKKYLFSYFEYLGKDFEADMKSISEDPETQRWWELTDPCQKSLPCRKAGEQWSSMEMLFLME